MSQTEAAFHLPIWKYSRVFQHVFYHVELAGTCGSSVSGRFVHYDLAIKALKAWPESETQLLKLEEIRKTLEENASRVATHEKMTITATVGEQFKDSRWYLGQMSSGLALCCNFEKELNAVMRFYLPGGLDPRLSLPVQCNCEFKPYEKPDGYPGYDIEFSSCE